MNYFSGFCLSGESDLFAPWLKKSDMVVSGFSYGAIRAFEYALKQKERTDRLILFSPAFFQNKKKSFKTLQMEAWRRDSSAYMGTFLKRCAQPGRYNLLPWFRPGSPDELDYLLNYIWNKERIASLLEKGITLEVFFGGKDKIIDSKPACDFFSEAGAVCYYIKEAGHILKPLIKNFEEEKAS
jgi:pimeloyl-ACP methyl ester carboxylesterase